MYHQLQAAYLRRSSRFVMKSLFIPDRAADVESAESAKIPLISFQISWPILTRPKFQSGHNIHSNSYFYCLIKNSLSLQGKRYSFQKALHCWVSGETRLGKILFQWANWYGHEGRACKKSCGILWSDGAFPNTTTQRFVFILKLLKMSWLAVVKVPPYFLQNN